MSVDRRWLYAQIFCPMPLDRMLTDCVGPVLDALERDGKVSTWFFVRYAEGGPHLRLRCRSDADIPDPAISALLENEIASYVARQVGQAGDWRLCYAPYEPEVHRYGGPAAISAAERHFHVSSTTVLARLPACIASGSARLATAVELLLVQLQATRLTSEQVDVLCRCLASSIAQYVPAERVEPALEACETKFEKSRARLVPYLARALAEAPERVWFQQCDAYYGTLADLAFRAERDGPEASRLNAAAYATAGRVLGHPWRRFQESFDAAHRHIASVLFSQIHMTNNRLGIPNIEESYVAYLAWRVLPALTVSPPVRR